MKFLLKPILLLIAFSLHLAAVGQVAPKETIGNDTTKIIWYANESFNLWNTNPQKGLLLADTALVLSSKFEFKKGKILAYRSLAVCNWSMASYAPALDASFKGIKIAEEVKDNELLLIFEHNLALIFGDLGDLDQAIYYFKRNIALSLELGNTDNLTGAYNNLGYYFLKKKLVDSSLYYYQQAFRLSEGNKTIKDAQYLFLSMSEAYFFKREYAKALEYCERAFTIYSKLNETVGLLECYTMFGKLAIVNGNLSLAQENLQRGFKMAKEGNFIYHLMPIYRSFATIDSTRGNFKQALIHYQKATSLEDSLNYIKQKQTFDRLLMQYRADQKEKENLLLKESNHIIAADAKIKKYLLIAALVTSALIIGLLIFFFNKKYVYQKRMEEARMKEQLTFEKIRIAKDLHDNIGSQLSVFTMDLSMLAKQNQLELPIHYQLNHRIHSIIDELRDTIWAINKEDIDTERLLDKINSLCSRFRKSTDRFQINITENVTDQNMILKPNQGLNIFRIVQEAINNGIRHSGGNKIEVVVESTPQKLVVKVNDNGNGFSNQPQIKGDHLGILNMKNRANEMNGTLHIQSGGSGTSITVEVPTT
jgi:signal transduction histidine kinase